MESNDSVGVAVAQPKSSFQRVDVATMCHDLLEMSMPVLVDEIDDRVGKAYSGMPDRLYVVDRNGKVAYKGGRGPFWYNPNEMEQSLVMTLLDQTTEESHTTKPADTQGKKDDQQEGPLRPANLNPSQRP